MSNLSSHVTVYSSNGCGYCAMAKKLLAGKGVTPTEINIDSDRGKMAEMMARSGRRTVPQIFIGEYHVGGFDDLLALDRQGRLEPML
ncbi:glutaredoxin 3 [Janthinobacterium agaricidamnosum]|uniref:Glutaredoxin n=1 Tax=Janthinobacterium agaricidamnosum NBRC 102515 = DSM 9628 TaxID=1349767 RepID=W0V9E2_9BURK|nr:glutaredoxin 3 [Janthinobacterium agaricidamnosum]CDG84491.1 glutaredoxin 3 [Janthinobacterium agaricidamnosum NBRC 102515 = DSM 9628]